MKRKDFIWNEMGTFDNGKMSPGLLKASMIETITDL